MVQSVDLGPTFLDLASSQNHLNELVKPTYPMDGKSILPLLTSNVPDTSNYNDFRWAALFEMYGGSSNIGLRYKNVTGYYKNHMVRMHEPRGLFSLVNSSFSHSTLRLLVLSKFTMVNDLFYSQYPNTYQAVRVINGPSELASESNLLYVEWCTGEQELYNMTVDPHQIYNLLAPVVASAHGNESTTVADSDDILALIHKLSRLLARLGDCIGSECYDLEDEHFEFSMEQNINVDVKRALSLESMRSSIRDRIRCHNPSNMTTNPENNNNRNNMHHLLFVNDWPIPEPFTHGFPFSDGDDVGEELLETWAAYEHYFY